MLLKDFVRSVAITVFTDNRGRGLHKTEYDDFCSEYGAVDLKQAGNVFHDRYIVLDYGTRTEQIFHCGASSKDGGNRVMTIETISDGALYHSLFDNLLTQPTLALA